MFDFVKHNDKQSQFVWKFESNIRPQYKFFYLFEIVYSISILHTFVLSEHDSQ